MVTIGILIPFFGTMLGAASVFLMRKKISANMHCVLSGFAAGVMSAAGIWSLLLPCIEQSGEPKWLPAAFGFAAGVVFLIACELLSARLRRAQTQARSALVLAVTVHNIPEGMAVGVGFAQALHAGTQGAMAAAFALALGIAIQNFPEGAIISLPLKARGKSKARAFFCGVLSGAVEPPAAVLTLLMSACIIKLLPLFLAFAAGAMFYVCVDELIPASKHHGGINTGVLGFTTGFLVMMVMDLLN